MLRELPATFEIVGSRFEGVILVLGALVMGVEPAYSLIGDLASNEIDLLTSGMVAVSVGLATLGVDQFFVQGTVSVTREEVTFFKKSLLFKSQWREPIMAYEGIRTVLSGKHEGGDTVINKWQVWLHHRKRTRRIKLAQANTSQYLEEDVRMYCQLFGLSRVER